MASKLFVASVIGIFLIGIVTAAWVFQYTGDIEGEVMATGKKLDVILGLSDFTLNTSSGNLTNTQNLTLDNKKQLKMMDLLMVVNKTLTELECPNYQNDCSVWFGWENGTEIPNATWFYMPKGLNYYKLETTCVEYSCGQNISVQVMMNEP